MGLPADEFLMNASDRSMIDAFLRAAPAYRSPGWLMIREAESRLNALVQGESRALAQAAGLKPEPFCNHISDEAAWSLLAPERQAIAFTIPFAGGVCGSGLGQYCVNHEEELRGLAAAMRQIAIEPLATPLVRYLEHWQIVMEEYRSTGTVSDVAKASAGFSLQEDLERVVWDTDWNRLRMLHVMRHPRQFFRSV